MRDVIAEYRAQLDAAGTDRLVEWEDLGASERLIRYGLCERCDEPRACVFVVIRTETGGMHLVDMLTCPNCNPNAEGFA